MKKRINKIFIGSFMFVASISVLLVTSCDSSKPEKIVKQTKSTIGKTTKETKKIIGIKPKNANLIKNISLDMLNAKPILPSTIIKIFDGISATQINKEFIAKKVNNADHLMGVVILEAQEGYEFENNSKTLLSNKFLLLTIKKVDNTPEKSKPTYTFTTPTNPIEDNLKLPPEKSKPTYTFTTPTNPIEDNLKLPPINPTEDNPELLPTNPTEDDEETIPADKIHLEELTKSKVVELGWDKLSYISLDMFSQDMPNIKSIGDNAFIGSSIRKIELPNSVISIGTKAFKDTFLSEINISNSVTEIRDGAFTQTRLNFSKFQLPNQFLNSDEIIRIGAYNIKTGAWLTKELVLSSGLSLLKHITKSYLQIVFPNITSIEAGAFLDAGILWFEIPETIEAIGFEAFKSCKLTTLKIPKSVKIIEGLAFFNNEIHTLILHDNLENIERLAFAKNKLKSWNVGSNTVVNQSAFYLQKK